MTQQQMVAEIKFLRKDNAALKDENFNLKGQLAVKDAIVKVEQERGDFFKEAASKGIKVGDNSMVIEQKYQEIVGQYKDENNRLRFENDKLRSSRNWRTFFGAVAGASAGAYVGRQSCK